MNERPRVTIAGASGFIGKNLLSELNDKFHINGLSRRAKESSSNVNWIEADLFSYQSTSQALQNTDIAIYLVHSMLPSSRLFQGTFQDTDLLIADNFAKACLENNVQQIIYLGGLVPEHNVSKHLESRKEVEDLFNSTDIPTTVLRAGMVVGDGGSSFEILKNLVLSLPVMILPSWTASRTQAIYIDDLVRVIINSINNKTLFNKTINVVNGQNITYKELIIEASKYFDGPELLLPVPINYTSFSKLWVKIFGSADYELVSPLIDSLLCDLPYFETPNEISDLVHFKKFNMMLEKIPKEKRRRLKAKKIKIGNTVRSIQRLSNPNDLGVNEISDHYIHWLPIHLKKLIKVKSTENKLYFKIIFFKPALLILQREDKTNELDRIKFHIVGGLLAKENNTGWLEFRKVCGGRYTLALINEFIPALPWYVYRYTQAWIHLRVMKAFSKYLSSKKLK